MYTLYILRCKDNSLYTGIAKDLEKRLEMHRAGTGSKYVRAKSPFAVVYTEKCKDRSSATKREMAIKKMSKEKKETLVISPPTRGS
ncbi:MAG: Excinuclease ABC C subunit domain protein [Candidatus Magasanikbacteria bacterium GW2011_GWD2_43_18]|uniref:Excinuclease ABC C subunit domain protein n=1 Tax=Candidatus Magasanikbacteria bacterium GW2011_GWE2_42_7 TaxID=1619052 RepID=A0A0G1BEA8_9BACT|nr:MAG: Excinuclease ABC C subunit domain protein [Candidatus Magasanikbacteria bacterium GW2011_GWC2_42_27]KKS71534.1 MAG: Excinuclease ABC C subunit domain protein [Candidatus Magasanikbacteria bacterium GW2011_GWE2_42_7]KKT04116.1 MAG: Excinuclease ABC C subunit domain protein [Candidatus Magasanikbacteria bacterium GW2011_GWD2_43_18]KKT25705.1 MAG: Excinuclease ABC C subunit domain protein [Candidatus Magasanikbacteria bacterium GW2011_GWA2_43_9]HBB38524.1 endonuclease [Candidatus Magasanik